MVFQKGISTCKNANTADDKYIDPNLIASYFKGDYLPRMKGMIDWLAEFIFTLCQLSLSDEVDKLGVNFSTYIYLKTTTVL